MNCPSRLPSYASTRPEERLCKVSRQLYGTLAQRFDACEERVWKRTLTLAAPDATPQCSEPSKTEALKLAQFEQVFKQIYFDKDCDRSELASPLHVGLRQVVAHLLAGNESLPAYERLNPAKSSQDTCSVSHDIQAAHTRVR
jgi:hypothetical protein